MECMIIKFNDKRCFFCGKELTGEIKTYSYGIFPLEKQHIIKERYNGWINACNLSRPELDNYNPGCQNKPGSECYTLLGPEQY
jgi:hypothetical protein